MLAQCSLFVQPRVFKGLVMRSHAPVACWAASLPWMTQQQRRRSSFASATPAAPSTDAGKGNYFHFFRIAKHPDLDVAALQKKYHNLQRLVHPDQQQVQAQQQQAEAADVAPATSSSPLPFACTSNEAKSSTDVSTYANAAYETLRAPYSRCRYLSRLVKAEEVKGNPLSAAEEEELLVEDDQRTMKAREVRPDAPMSDDFLMEMLAMNELIFAGDSSDEGVRQQWSVLRFDLEDRAVGYFKDAIKSWNDGDMGAFHHIVHEWTYVATALNNLKERMLE
ncbi:conserved hypothetical protein [Leishmania major strain Friedlin]|uniref:J domain-containing protein n=1 Tax=Leishmania major TaxID=5664 RepID=Q4Q9S1_LEIMA|nr:conserved hypothetical protein [Leishmania major strain Friedlin]CAG9575189.1 DnaJ_domain-containing_protein/JDP36/J36 [Leishmania major strain Friedlin]CAJ05386.1 conserved hypothetical protein [Leishmania major strain Friedlin]|eukprot:XP_001683927.1 conserved hypothetical protein [Leishmania major strain Friedlin]